MLQYKMEAFPLQVYAYVGNSVQGNPFDEEFVT